MVEGIQANSPDIVVADKINDTTTLIDITVPCDLSELKEMEKVNKSQVLREELENNMEDNCHICPFGDWRHWYYKTKLQRMTCLNHM